MKLSITKKLLIVIGILVILQVILLVVSGNYEIVLLNVTLFDIALYIHFSIVLMISILIMISIYKKYSKKIKSIILCVLVSIGTMLWILSVSIGTKELLHNEPKFYYLQVYGDECSEEIVVKEHGFFYNTIGAFYVKKGCMLKIIDGSSYKIESDNSPISQEQYIAEYSNQTKKVTVTSLDGKKDNEFYFEIPLY